MSALSLSTCTCARQAVSGLTVLCVVVACYLPLHILWSVYSFSFDECLGSLQLEDLTNKPATNTWNTWFGAGAQHSHWPRAHSGITMVSCASEAPLGRETKAVIQARGGPGPPPFSLSLQKLPWYSLVFLGICKTKITCSQYHRCPRSKAQTLTVPAGLAVPSGGARPAPWQARLHRTQLAQTPI